ncbi:MAG: hypothetical protein ACNA8W_08515 [Bradymonadaceae bacterium]
MADVNTNHIANHPNNQPADASNHHLTDAPSEEDVGGPDEPDGPVVSECGTCGVRMTCSLEEGRCICWPGHSFVDAQGCVEMPYGTGEDGSRIFHDEVNLAHDALMEGGDRDAPWYAVESVVNNSLKVAGPITDIGAGDEVLIINLQARTPDPSHVGRYQLARVRLVDGDQVYFYGSIDAQLGSPVDHSIALVRVPNYDDLHLQSNARLVTVPYDGSVGGVIAMRVAGTLTIDEGGVIDVKGRGYRGGAAPIAANDMGVQGEGRLGPGSRGQQQPNDGGGGAKYCGAGGNHLFGATDCSPSPSTEASLASKSGEGYGMSPLERLHLGSGGGSLHHGASAPGASCPGAGGAGGGVILIFANKAEVYEGMLDACGQAAEAICIHDGRFSAPGGGAGGSVFFRAARLDGRGYLGSVEGAKATDYVVDQTSTHTGIGGGGGSGEALVELEDFDHLSWEGRETELIRPSNDIR